MLQRIQRVLTRAYDLHVVPDVEQFVCGPDLVHATAGEGAARRGELLLVLEDEQGIHVGLYLDPAVLERLSAADPDFRSVCLATEGVSHFVYLSFRADNDEQVSQLELELQAEVDKYAFFLEGLCKDPPPTRQSRAASRNRAPRRASLSVPFPSRGDGAPSAFAAAQRASAGLFDAHGGELAGNGVGLIRARSRALRARLFSEQRFIDPPGTTEGERYRLANRAAARYAASLEARFVDRGRVDDLWSELRRFYRLGGRQKLERTRTL